MTLSHSLPMVTIGVPVYNEKKYINESLETLLAQTYPNIEIIIADNASTDGTSEICAEYALKYPHIEHVRHPNNIGQHTNFNYLVHSAAGAYFCWASGHDLLEPTFVADSVAVLEADLRAVLAYPRTVNMTKEGVRTREKVRPFDIRQMAPARRFLEVIWRVDCNYVYGTWRRSAMLSSHLFQRFPACDRVFLGEMAILGTFVPVETFKYYRMSREHVQTEIEKRHRIMAYLMPHRKYTDAELSGNDFYHPTIAACYRIVQDSQFLFFTRLRLYTSIWLSGAMKFHLFPGADFLSALSKKILSRSVYERLLSMMQ